MLDYELLEHPVFTYLHIASISTGAIWHGSNFPKVFAETFVTVTYLNKAIYPGEHISCTIIQAG